MIVLWRKVLRDLRGRWPVVASVAGIMSLGIAVFSAMTGAWRDLDGARQRYYAAQALHDVRITAANLSPHHLAAVARSGGANTAVGRIQLAATVHLPGAATAVKGVALSAPEPGEAKVTVPLLAAGGWFSSAEAAQVVLIDAFASARQIAIGSKLRLRIEQQELEMRVVGTVHSPEFVYLLPPSGGLAPDPGAFAVAYLPLRVARRVSGLSGGYNEILVRLHDRGGAVLAQSRALFVNLLKEAGPLKGAGLRTVNLSRDSPSVRFLADELDGLRVQSIVLPALFLLMAVLVLNVVMARRVRAERTLIGTFKALGFSWLQIARHYLAFALLASMPGAIGGVGLGGLMQSAMVGVYREIYALPGLQWALYPDLLAGALLLAGSSAVLGTAAALLRIRKLTPASALRPYTPQMSRAVRITATGWPWRALPLVWRMALRAIIRNPGRALTTLVATAGASALLLATLNTKEALDHLLAHEFVASAHQDGTVYLSEPVAAGVLREFSSIAGVRRVEGELTLPVEMRFGGVTKRLTLRGLAAGNRFTTPLDNTGAAVSIPRQGVVLSNKLRELLGVNVGERVQVRPLLGAARARWLTVSGGTETYLGLSAFAARRHLSAVLGEIDVINTVLLSTDTGSMAPGSMAPALKRALLEFAAVQGSQARLHVIRQVQKSFGQTVGAVIAVLIIVCGLLAGAVLLISAQVNLEERARETAMLRALGFSAFAVARILMAEYVLLAALGVGIGLLAGSGLSGWLAHVYSTELYRFPAVLSLEQLMAGTAAMVLFVLMALAAMGQLVRWQAWRSILSVRE
ncbi:MAG: FtsX-like permease family protein [Gammaproteobacteria bacterium]|nr:FtsX-like permease family protein [Gammaproteobacteria bacterium]